MKRPLIVVRMLSAQVYERLFLGRWESLGGMVLLGFFVFVFLFATVHRRDLSSEWAEYSVKYFPIERYPNLIRLWIEHGYFKHGGLRFLEPVDQNPTQEVYRSNPMGFLQAAHLLERVNYWLRGKFSYMLLVLHNQAWVWFSSALLGVLGMRLAKRMELKPLYTLFLGAACAITYQTFPINLWYYWEIYPTTVLSFFAILFLLIEEVSFGRAGLPRWVMVLRGLCVFALVYTELYSALFFLAMYAVAASLLAPETHSWSRSLRTVILPAGSALGVFALQLLWVRFAYPGVRLIGAAFSYRTGLDGSTQFYVTHLDLIVTRYSLKLNAPLTLLVQSWFLFVAGGISIVLLVVLYLTRLPQLKGALLILAMALGLYVPFVFVFSQAAVIHPYGYDAYLAIPLIVALFAVLPASLERLAKNTGVITFSMILIAFCYSMVQLRVYAVTFPLKNSPEGCGSHTICQRDFPPEIGSRHPAGGPPRVPFPPLGHDSARVTLSLSSLPLVELGITPGLMIRMSSLPRILRRME